MCLLITIELVYLYTINKGEKREDGTVPFHPKQQLSLIKSTLCYFLSIWVKVINYFLKISPLFLWLDKCYAGVLSYPVDPNQREWAHWRCRTVAPLDIRVDGRRSYSSNHTNLLIYCAQIVAHCFGLTLIRNIFCENVNAKRIPVRNTFYFRCHYLPLNIF